MRNFTQLELFLTIILQVNWKCLAILLFFFFQFRPRYLNKILAGYIFVVVNCNSLSFIIRCYQRPQLEFTISKPVGSLFSFFVPYEVEQLKIITNTKGHSEETRLKLCRDARRIDGWKKGVVESQFRKEFLWNCYVCPSWDSGSWNNQGENLGDQQFWGKLMNILTL